MELSEFSKAVLKLVLLPFVLLAVLLSLPFIPLFNRLSRHGPPRYTCVQAAEVIETFCYGGGGDYDWDDFVSRDIRDEYLETVRQRCLQVRDDYPPPDGRGWCSKDGVDVLLSYAEECRRHGV